MPEDADFPDTFSFVKIVPETKYEDGLPINSEYVIALSQEVDVHDDLKNKHIVWHF